MTKKLTKAEAEILRSNGFVTGKAAGIKVCRDGQTYWKIIITKESGVGYMRKIVDMADYGYMIANSKSNHPQAFKTLTEAIEYPS